MTDAMTVRLREELLDSQGLWERRLADAVATAWGVSPFSFVLRFYNGLGGWIASSTLFRARNAAAVALIGATEAARRLREHRLGRDADDKLDRLGAFGEDDGMLREARFRLAGYVREAGLPDSLLTLSDEQLAARAVAVESRFLEGVRTRVEALVRRLAAANSRTGVRLLYEIVLLSLPALILLRAGKNFFWDTFIGPALTDRPVAVIYGADYWLAAAVFATLWAGLLVGLFTRRLRRGLNREVNELARGLADRRVPGGLFPALEETVDSAKQSADRLHRLREDANAARERLAGSRRLAGPAAGVKPYGGD